MTSAPSGGHRCRAAARWVPELHAPTGGINHLAVAAVIDLAQLESSNLSRAFSCTSEVVWLTATMLARLVTVCFLSALLGCGKNSPSSDTQAEPEPAAIDGATQSSVAGRSSAPVLQKVEPDEAQIATTLAELTQVVRKYSVEQRSAPKTVEELVADGYLNRLPPPPPGKRFAINKNLQVYLTDD